MNPNLTAERPTFVTHLECSMTGERYEADQLHGLSRVGRPLLVRYDLDAVRAHLPKPMLAARPRNSLACLMAQFEIWAASRPGLDRQTMPRPACRCRILVRPTA